MKPILVIMIDLLMANWNEAYNNGRPYKNWGRIQHRLEKQLQRLKKGAYKK